MRSYVNLLAVALAAPMVSGALSAPIYHRYGNQLVEFKGRAVDKGNLRAEADLTPSDLVVLGATRLPAVPATPPFNLGPPPLVPSLAIFRSGHGTGMAHLNIFYDLHPGRVAFGGSGRSRQQIGRAHV